MKPKIIIADDSQTIQKVIKITLAKQDFELIECLDESQLVELVSTHNPALVLLDFNLSENKTGYDLAKEIKALAQSKIMLLYGTFDSIEESLFSEAGVNSHIVKPFDGSKFIALCESLISDNALDTEKEEESEEIFEIEENATEGEPLDSDTVDFGEAFEGGAEINFDEISLDDDEWVVNQPTIKNESEKEKEPDFLAANEVVSEEELNTLEASMHDWGIDVPTVIGYKANPVGMPAVIGEEGNLEAEAVAMEDGTEDETILPDQSDLEYPDMMSVSDTKPKFTPMGELEEISIDATDEDILTVSIDDTAGTNSQEEISAIEEQIADEVGQDDSLWSTDEVIEKNTQKQFEQMVEPAIELKSEQNPQDNVESSISASELEAKLDAMISPMVEKMVNDKIEKIIEKISWEVIPDLAENLIKKQLKQISEEILKS